MILKKWEDLPAYMQTDEVKKYYQILSHKKISLFFKRLFDIIASVCLLILLCIPMLVIALLIKLDSKGTVFYRQERVTTNGKVFKIHKFRTMVSNADQMGNLVTVNNDQRITKIGSTLRKFRLDELPQLLDVLVGDMSFVGTRPEVKKYVDAYTPEMRATLLLPAGITSEASIEYKDESFLLDGSLNPDKTYINEVLPEKMKYNLDSIIHYSFLADLKTMIKTVVAVFR